MLPKTCTTRGESFPLQDKQSSIQHKISINPPYLTSLPHIAKAPTLIPPPTPPTHLRLPQRARIHLLRRTPTPLLIISHHLPTSTIPTLTNIPPRQLGRQRPSRRRINRHIPHSQPRFRERFIEIIDIPLTEQLIIQNLGLIDESLESFFRVERCAGEVKGEVESFGFDFGAGDGVWDDDLFDAGGVGGWV